jgi:uncharacterized protein YuzE
LGSIARWFQRLIDPILSRVSIRIEQFDGGEVLYLALDPDGVWARSEFPDELVTVDYNAQGGIIGIELLGSIARSGADALLAALREANGVQNRDAVQQVLQPVTA